MGDPETTPGWEKPAEPQEPETPVAEVVPTVGKEPSAWPADDFRSPAPDEDDEADPEPDGET